MIIIHRPHFEDVYGFEAIYWDKSVIYLCGGADKTANQWVDQQFAEWVFSRWVNIRIIRTVCKKGGGLLQLEIIIQHCNLEAEPGNSSRAAVNQKKP